MRRTWEEKKADFTLKSNNPNLKGGEKQQNIFQVNGYMNLFRGGKFSDRASFEKLLAVSDAGPLDLFFSEVNMSEFFGMYPVLKNIYLHHIL